MVMNFWEWDYPWPINSVSAKSNTGLEKKKWMKRNKKSHHFPMTGFIRNQNC